MPWCLNHSTINEALHIRQMKYVCQDIEIRYISVIQNQNSYMPPYQLNDITNVCIICQYDRLISYEAWWRHQMETFSALLAICAGNSPVPGEFLAQRPVTRSFDVFFDLRVNKRLSKQSWGWWFETPWSSLWRHCNATIAFPSLQLYFPSHTTPANGAPLIPSVWICHHTAYCLVFACLMPRSNNAYTFRENREFVFIIIVQFMMSANFRIRFG